MLACVCQPADPNIFRRSPTPLVTTPIKISSKGAIPKVVPGRSIRITDSVVTTSNSSNSDRDKNDSSAATSLSMSVSLPEPNREALLSFGGEKKVKEKTNELQISNSKISNHFSKNSSVVKKCAKKYHTKHKLRKREKHEKNDITVSNCDKENLGLSSGNVFTCDTSLKEKAEEYPKVSKIVTSCSMPATITLHEQNLHQIYL